MTGNNISEHSRSSRREREIISWLAYLSLAGLSCFVITVVLLHWLQPDLDPLNDVISYYIHGAGGWLLTVGFLALAIGSFALTAGVGRAVHGPGARVGRWLLFIWSASTLLVGIFPTDPPGNWESPPSTVGTIHNNAAMIGALALPIAALMLARSFRRDLRWQPKAALLLVLAIAIVVSLGAFIASIVSVMILPGPPLLFGLTDRILTGLCVAWLGAVAVGLLQAESNSQKAA